MSVGRQTHPQKGSRTCISLDITDSKQEEAPQEQQAHYCLTRADLPRGVQAAQLVHAAGESSPGNMRPGTFAVVLQARDEQHLREIGWELCKAGIEHRLIFEPDAPWTGQLMSIGCVPGPRSRFRSILSRLPLLK